MGVFRIPRLVQQYPRHRRWVNTKPPAPNAWQVFPTDSTTEADAVAKHPTLNKADVDEAWQIEKYDPFVDLHNWFSWGGADVTISSNQLRIASELTNGYHGIDYGVYVDMTGRFASIYCPDAGSTSIVSWEVYPLNMAVDSNNQLFWFISPNAGLLRAYKKISGSNTVLAETTYNSAVHKYFRIRENGGTTYFDYSTDEANWVNFWSGTNPLTMTNILIDVLAGTWQAEASTTAALFDDFFLSGRAEHLAVTKGISDSDTPTDSAAKTATLNKSDTASDTDAAAKTPTLNKSDTASSSDAAAKTPTLGKSDSDTPTDAVAKTPTLNKSDSVTPSDAFSRVVTYLRGFADSITTTDASVKTATLGKADTATSSDAAAKSVTKPTTDTATSSDAASKTPTLKKNDSTSETDAAVKNVTKRPADSSTPTDAASKSATHAVSDSTSETDSVAKSLSKAIADTISATEAAIKTMGKVITDAVTPTDSPAKSVILAKADSASGSDVAFKTMVLTKSDSVSESDDLSKAITLQKADSSTILDLLSKAVGLVRGDIAGSADSDPVTKAIIKAVADSQGASDHEVHNAGGNILTFFDVVHVTDRVFINPQFPGFTVIADTDSGAMVVITEDGKTIAATGTGEADLPTESGQKAVQVDSGSVNIGIEAN